MAKPDAPTIARSKKPRPGLLGVLAQTLRYWRPHAGAAGVLAILLAIEQAYGAAFGFALKVMVDRALPRRDTALVVTILSALGVGFLAMAAAKVAADWLIARVGARILTALRARMFRHLQSLSIDYFGQRTVGDLVARFTSDVADVENAVTTRLVDGAFSTVGLVVFGGLLFSLDRRLALVVLAGLPLVLLSGRLFGSRTGDARQVLRAREADLVSAVSENAYVQPVVKLFGLAGSASQRFDSRLDDLEKYAVRSSYFAALLGTVSVLAVLLFQLVVMGIGAWLVLRGDLALGTLVAFTTLNVSVSKQAYDLTKKVVPSFITAGAGLARIDELLAERPEVADRPGAVALPRAVSDIRLERVSFRYRDGGRGLDEVDVHVVARTTVAFVGASGSGKSTALRLLLRLYDPHEGRVTFGGRDLRDATLESLHAQIGAVFQEPLLVDGTIRDNIRLGREDATDPEIEAAARAAEIHDAVMSMPSRYDSSVGERGARLSGGQRQRVAIARALLRDPTLLVLDEATSALDPRSEAAINATVQHLARTRTTVIVTHRLASVTWADQIVVLDGGRVVQSGRHEELLASDGAYADLWRKQSGVEVSAEGRARVSADWLHDVPILTDVPREILATVAAEFELDRRPAGDIVFQRGDSGDKFYVIARGKVDVTGANATTIAVLTDGDFFGEMALLDRIPRSATVTTVTPCWFLTLDRARFDALMERAPELRSAVQRIVSERVHRDRMSEELR